MTHLSLWREIARQSISLANGKLFKKAGQIGAVCLWSKRTPEGKKHLTQSLIGNSIGGFLPPADEGIVYDRTGNLAARFVSSVEESCLSDSRPPTPDSPPEGIEFYHLDGGYTGTVKIPENLHGILFKGNFGPPVFSPDSTLLAYVADGLPTRTKTSDMGQHNSNRFVYRQSWGETYDKQCLGRLFIADVVKESVIAIDWPNETESLGQVCWEDSSRVIITAWETDGCHRLGIAACQNRRSKIYRVELNLEGDGSQTTSIKPVSIEEIKVEGNEILHSPICSNDGYKWNAFCVVPNSNKGLHWSSVRVASQREGGVVVVGEEPMKADLVHKRVNWKVLNNHVLIETLTTEGPFPTTELKLLNLQNSPPTNTTVIHREVMEGHRGTLRLVDVLEPDYVLISLQSEDAPTCVKICQLVQIGDDFVLKPNLPSFPTHTIPPLFAATHYIDRRHILQIPLNLSKPLIVFLHGGPHAVSLNEFSTSLAFFARQGYPVVCVNYRGSIGFPDEEVLSLPGRAGTQDVSDCVAAIKQAQLLVQSELQKNAQIPSSILSPKVFVVGGSHGGFLALHLAGQHPELVQAVSVRNPVTNILSLLSTSDIPDWSLYEGSGDFSFVACQPLESQKLTQLLHSSPIFHVSKVEAPILIALGEDDKRVPPSQGVEYFRAITASGQAPDKHKLLSYPKNGHALGHPEAEADYWIQTANFFDKNASS